MTEGKGAAHQELPALRQPCLRESEDELADCPIFSPPVYRQRYEAVIEYVSKIQAKTVLDMGCAECKLLMLLARDPRCITVTQLAGVDIQRDLLESKDSVIRPRLYEHLMPRETPLTISLYAGSIAEPDSRFAGWDVVSCIEVIEHLDDHVLADVPAAVFGSLHPSAVLVSTPNAEFNTLFKTLPAGEFRHPDHRFEWTRPEFQAWCKTIGEKYGYAVSFSGIGAGPAGTEHLGCCSQMAVFEVLEEENEREEPTPATAPCQSDHPSRWATETRATSTVAESQSPGSSAQLVHVANHDNDNALCKADEHCTMADHPSGPSRSEIRVGNAEDNHHHWVSYALVAEQVYPFKPPLPRSEKVLNEMAYCYYKLVREAEKSDESEDCWLDDEGMQWSVQLAAFTRQRSLQQLNCSVEELRELLAGKENGHLGLWLSTDGAAVCGRNYDRGYNDSDSEQSDQSEDEVDIGAGSDEVGIMNVHESGGWD